MARISYLPDKQELDIQPAETILQASLRAGIPHTHVLDLNDRDVRAVLCV